jgi:hypothetical protein
VTQWGRVAFLTVVGVLAFETALPLAWRFGYKAPEWPFAGPAPFILFFLGVTFLLFLAVEPIRVRQGHWRHLFVYPPLWMAVIMSLLIVAFADRHIPSWYAVRPTWEDRGTLKFIAATLALAVIARQLPFRRQKPLKTLSTATEITWDEIAKWLKSGERAVEPDEIDFFRHREIAQRVSAAVREGRSVTVIGRFGSGKTGILNAVRAELLSQEGELFVIAELNAWAIAKPEDAPRLALDRIISALDQYADMQKFRGMPTAYRRLVDAEPTGRLAKLLGPQPEGDPILQLGRLSPVLEALNACVVLFLEDVERAEQAGFDTRHLQRFMWAVKETERISFVMAYAV